MTTVLVAAIARNRIGTVKKMHDDDEGDGNARLLLLFNIDLIILEKLSNPIRSLFVRCKDPSKRVCEGGKNSISWELNVYCRVHDVFCFFGCSLLFLLKHK